MKLHYKIWAFIPLLIVAVCKADMSLSVMPDSIVALEQLADMDITQKKTWTIRSSQGFVGLDRHKKKIVHIKPGACIIKNEHGHILINGKPCFEERLMLQPNSGTFSINKRSYKGSLGVICYNNRIKLVRYGAGNADSTIMQSSEQSSHQAENGVNGVKQQFMVRVLLDEQEDASYNQWVLTSEKGFLLINPETPSKKTQFPMQELSIRVKRGGMILINGQQIFEGQVLITPLSGVVSFGENTYKGSIWIYKDDESVMLINCVGIEDYVASVLCTESWPGWPLEVNKVFAIASRTYVIAMVQNASNSKRPYHVKNTNAHQTYSGNTMEIHKKAVQHTKGLFLTYENQPITAMFDACCGGLIPSKIHGVNFNHAPYLARTYACNYCKTCKIYSWETQYQVNHLEEVLRKELISLRRLKDIKIVKKDGAGLAQRVRIKASGREHTLTGKKMYSLLKQKVKSYCYTVRKVADRVIFKGRGYGHHLGLCQWGAKEMVRHGWDHKSILAFYYPGTTLMRLV